MSETTTNPAAGLLFIISGPSGCGKSTLTHRLLAEVPGLAFSVSHTTRQPRPGERDGVDYHFVDRSAFIALRDQEPSGFFEWAEVHGNLYGTSVEEVRRKLAQGLDIILDIDVQGARQMLARPEGRDAASIFIGPPSMAVLAERLEQRGDAGDSFELRLKNAREELACAPDYAYLLVNDDLETAATALKSIVIAERLRHRRHPDGRPAASPL